MNAAPDTKIPSPVPEKPTEEQVKAYLKSLTPVAVKHQRNPICGHGIAGKNEPRTNCRECWQTFFFMNPGIVAGARSVVSVYGRKRLESLRGLKFVKMLDRTLGLVAQQMEKTA